MSEKLRLTQWPTFNFYRGGGGQFLILEFDSSVSIRRIIYKFLNVCPFDYTAVALSGKVERS